MRRVLVIDDSLTVRMDLDEAFQAAGWATTLCGSAGEARDALRRGAVDGIVLDVLLPDGDGLELLRELRSHPATAGIPVILLSTEREVADRIETPADAADAYVGKPYDRTQLVAGLHRLVRRRPGRDPGDPSPLILAVDDSPTYLDSLVSRLRRDRRRVVEAASGEDAIARLRTHAVDCVLLDMLMPGMSGPDLCRHLKGSADWRSIPVIMLTGRDDHEAIVESFDAGADDYVAKSSDFEVLRARLDAQLHRRQFEHEAQRIREVLHQKDLEVAEVKAAIAERTRVENELRAAKLAAEHARTRAEEASRAKDHFLAVLSHELRTPLTPVLAAVALLQRDETLPERARHRLDLVRRNVELQSRLIDDLLDLTRIVRGKVELDRRRVELCTVIERAAEVCRPDVDARRLHFGIDYGPGRPYLIDADAARLQQVFWNVLKNAIKFTPLAGCVGVRCRPDGADVVIEINDSGIGMEPAAIERIFDAFAQAELSITRQFGGLGLGLAISKVLVELHGGTITAHSDGPGKGATFTIRLPMIAGVTGDGALVPAGRREAPPRALSILLVEDHGDTAEMMVGVLELSGHRVRTAGDVAAALDLAEHDRFDLLISDLGLPDRSGLELMRDLRRRGHRFPAIALSGYGQEKDVEQSRRAGFQTHLVKPVDVDHLLETIDEVLAGQT